MIAINVTVAICQFGILQFLFGKRINISSGDLWKTRELFGLFGMIPFEPTYVIIICREQLSSRPILASALVLAPVHSLSSPRFEHKKFIFDVNMHQVP